MNKKEEFISIIITNFNKEKYLVKSLNSLFNQNYKNFEIILACVPFPTPGGPMINNFIFSPS